jgi:DNA-binding transcriptional LysR family regulator
MGYRRTFNRELAKMDIDIVPALEVGRTDLITLLLEEGEGISYLPDFVTDEYVKKGSLVRLDVIDINIEIWKQLIYHKNKWISNSMKTFIEYVKKA